MVPDGLFENHMDSYGVTPLLGACLAPMSPACVVGVLYLVGCCRARVVGLVCVHCVWDRCVFCVCGCCGWCVCVSVFSVRVLLVVAAAVGLPMLV